MLKKIDGKVQFVPDKYPVQLGGSAQVRPTPRRHSSTEIPSAFMDALQAVLLKHNIKNNP